MHKFVLICLLGVLASAVVVVASECPNGDLSGNCAVGFEDVLILAQNWLGGGRNPGDIIPDSEINMRDFAALADNWGKAGVPVIINEINFDHDVKTDPLEYIELFNRTGEDVDISNWHFRSGVTFEFPADTILPAGGYIAVAQDPDRVQTKYGAFSSLLYGPWAGRLSNGGERVELCDADGNEINQVDYQLGFPWPTVGDSVPDASPSNGTGHSIQLVNSYIDNDLGGSWRSGIPTPTGSNFPVYLDNPPPHMRQVKHSPKEPEGGEDVSVTVKVTDSDGVASVTLEYQRVPPGAYISYTDRSYLGGWVSLAMRDDGTAGDEEADDETYTCVIDGSIQTHRLLVRYRITAIDSTGASIRGPYDDDPVPNFAYFVYDGVPAWYGAVRPGVTSVVEYGADLMRSLPVYHLISKNADVETCTWTSGYTGDEYLWYGTMVYDGRVYDHIRYRARGGVWRYAMGKNMWKFDFNRGHRFQARDDYGRKYDTIWDKLNLSAIIQQGNYWHRGEQGMFEAAGFRLFNLAGSAAPKTNWLQFRIVDEADESGATQYDGDFWGLYLVVEQMDGAFLDEHGLPDGNLYKMDGTYANGGDLNNQGPTGATDKSDLIAFKAGYSGNPDASWWTANADVDGYFSYRTIVDGMHHYDIGSGKNYFYYLNPVPDASGHYLWSELAWDLDLTWADNMYDCGNSGRDPFKQYGLWDNSTLRVRRNNRIREIRDLILNSDQGWQLLDDLASIVDTPVGGPSMVDADQAMWDYNPIMTSGYVNSSKAGMGRFYAGNAPSIIIPSPGGFRGMVQLMKDYIVRRATVGDPSEGEAAIDNMAYDASIPYTPVVTYTGSPEYPINTLTFESSDFGDPQGISSQPGTKWRIAEVGSAVQVDTSVLVPEEDLWKYFKGTKEPSLVQGEWRELNFVEDADWVEQNTPIGYGEPFTVPELLDMRGSYSTIYLRKEFYISDLNAIKTVNVELMFDDGFNFWVNGVFAGARNLRNPGATYDTVTGGDWEQRDFTLIGSLDPYTYLVPGRNIVTIQVINQSLSDSEDCFIDLRMTAELYENPEPGSQRARPHYEIDPVWENSDWNSYVQAIHIPATVVEVGHTYRVRCKMRDDTDRWSHWSEPIEFVAGEQEPAPVLEHLRITELMYNPADADASRGELDVDNDDFEFIELKNTGDEDIDLTTVSFVDGITFHFADGNVPTLGPSEFVLVVRNRDAFLSRYTLQVSAFIAGEYKDSGEKLSNSGETVELSDTWQGVIARFSYSDGRGWPLPADGTGHSLVPLASAIPTEPEGSLDYCGNWRHSVFLPGSPGQDDPDLPRSVVINEIMAHTDYSDPAYPEHDSDDWIELHNTSSGSINLSGWYLSDDKNDPAKWAIPSVTISGNGYISFNEVTHFHNPLTTGFGLNKSGEVVVLSYLPGTYDDRVVDFVRFKGEENFVSLGRYPDGGDYWLHQAPSRDLPNNSGILDIVIDEIMYHPMDPAEEYVELYNPTAGRIDLTNMIGGWRMDDEDTQGYTFNAGTYIDPGARLVVVAFDPASDTSRLEAFVGIYGTGSLTPGVEIVGPFPGNLSNGGERISLKRPQAPDEPGDAVSWVVVDEVVYGDVPPWSIEADGTGFALQRIHADAEHSGNDPANWRVASATPGSSP